MKSKALGVLAMASLLAGGSTTLRTRTKSKREVNDEIAQAGLLNLERQRQKYRAMLVRSGRVTDYGYCIAINQRNADRKRVKSQFAVS